MSYELLTNLQREALIKNIEAIPTFRQCGIAIQKKEGAKIIKPSPMPRGLGTWVVLEKKDKKSKVDGKKEFSWGWEIFGTTLSCVAAGTAAAAIGLTTPITGGALL